MENSKRPELMPSIQTHMHTHMHSLQSELRAFALAVVEHGNVLTWIVKEGSVCWVVAVNELMNEPAHMHTPIWLVFYTKVRLNTSSCVQWLSCVQLCVSGHKTGEPFVKVKVQAGDNLRSLLTLTVIQQCGTLHMREYKFDVRLK